MSSGFFQRHALLLAVSILGLSACATLDQYDADSHDTAVSSPPSAWAERQLYLSGIAHWQLRGRLALQTADDSWSASIRWQQSPAYYAIDLSGPLGSNAMSVRGGPGLVVMQTPAGEKFTETSVDRLIEARTGWQIPVAGLQYWVRGLRAPRATAQQKFDPQGRLSELRQSGWVIQYQSYLRKDEIEMPGKIQLSNARFKLKLRVHDWQIGMPSS